MKHMSLEEMDHFLRHMKVHAEEVRKGVFLKDKYYLERLKVAQRLALELSHDIIHIMRIKEFKGYENADFSFNIALPDNWKNHEFRTFDYTSFCVGCKLKNAFDLGVVSEKELSLDSKDMEQQMENLSNAIQDSEVLIKLLEEHFSK